MTIALEAPPVVTGCVRYDWQIMAAREHEGVVLNVGCNEDPSKLRKRYGSRIVNCDLEGWDHHMNRPNHVDRIFNCLEMPWPFEDDSAELVIFGDILEHFTVDAIVRALTEARRVATHVAVTVPEDTRIDPDQAAADWATEAYNLHTTIVTREIILNCCERAGWTVTRYHEDEWGFDDIRGHCVLARRTA